LLAMHTVLIFSGKGGSSKTTLTRELAVAASLAGRSVAIADLDPQAGLTGWFSRREAETPSLVKIPTGYDLTPLAKAGIDELIIDLPPGVPPYVDKLIQQADVVLVPCRPSPDDLTAAASVVPKLARHPQWAFVMVQTLHRSRLSDGALRQLASLGRVAPVSLGSRQDYPLAAIEGAAAVEFASTKSADEVTQLRAYVNKMVGLEDGKKASRRSRRHGNKQGESG
jgi:chromosome partitioning protein